MHKVVNLLFSNSHLKIQNSNCIVDRLFFLRVYELFLAERKKRVSADRSEVSNVFSRIANVILFNPLTWGTALLQSNAQRGVA